MSRQMALAASSPEVSGVREEVEALQKRQALAGERLGLSDTFSQAAAEPLLRQAPAELELGEKGEMQSAVCFRTGSMEPVTLAYHPITPSPVGPRLLIALGSLPKGFSRLALRRWTGRGTGLVVVAESEHPRLVSDHSEPWGPPLVAMAAMAQVGLNAHASLTMVT
jgi:hypothetical protein